MIDNLTEAITHAKEVAKEIRQANEEMPNGCKLSKGLCECATEHEQLADWLTELKERREADRWNVIRTEADLPKESDNYLIQLDNNWNEQLTAFFSKGVGFCFMGSVLKDVTAWKPLPEPYESEDK